jgi:hypothetical protein
MSEPATRALVLRQFAALRRQGLGALEALQHLSEGLPPGAVREDCLLASRALAAGGAETGSDFARVLTDSTGGPEQAESLARAFEARLDAQDALAAPAFLLQFVLIGPLVVLSLLGWLLRRDFFGMEGLSLPGPTQALRELALSLQYLGLPLAAGCFFAVRAVRTKFSPGFQDFTRATRLLEASTRAEASVDFRALQLQPLEQQVLQALRAHGGLAPAFRALAAELSGEGRASVAAFRSLGPVVAVFVVIGVYLGVLIALYLPIFSIAGAIK